MIWKKDKLRPSQPYFVLDTNNFYQEVYLQQGISHFYTFEVNENSFLRTVPDACIDLFFEYKDNSMQGFVCGTRLKYSLDDWRGSKEVFGIRFMPGINPALINSRMSFLLNSRKPVLCLINGDSSWYFELAKEKDFYQRIRIFLSAYTKAQKRTEKAFGKKELVQSVKSMVYNSDGIIKISELEENTGYTERYINQVFIEEMGFSPKTFCKIIQFQRALEFLNYGAPDKMTEAAVALGYYDQPQFIKDFSKYAGMTPLKYLKLIQSSDYQKRIKTNVLDKGV